MDTVRICYDQFLFLSISLYFSENMGDEANEERAKQINDKCNEIEQQFGHIFTGKNWNSLLKICEKKITFVYILATIEGENLSDVYDRICEVINNENTVDFVWVPSDEKI